VNLNDLVFVKELTPETVIFNLYPNPANTYIDLKLENLNGEIGISILNLSGETVWHEKYNAENGTLLKKLDISELSVGTYLIKIDTGSHLLLEKFIKL
jgi:hypothetical protein